MYGVPIFLFSLKTNLLFNLKILGGFFFRPLTSDKHPPPVRSVSRPPLILKQAKRKKDTPS